MKFGVRKPSLTKRFAARTSWKRAIRHNIGFKAPRNFGWFTNPKRAVYNRVYNRTTFKADGIIVLAIVLIFTLLGAIIKGLIDLFSNSAPNTNYLDETDATIYCPRCNSVMVLRNGRRGKFYGCSTFPRCRGTSEYLQIQSHSK